MSCNECFILSLIVESEDNNKHEILNNFSETFKKTRNKKMC